MLLEDIFGDNNNKLCESYNGYDQETLKII
jgi:hypothetical protein